MKRIGCFHAHYSNIEPIDGALGAYDVEWIHFVDPGLDRIKNDAGFTAETAEAKVLETLDWIAKCHVDAMLVTCTFFTAIIDEDAHRFPVPVIKIDDPLFREIAASSQPTVLVFTNPATVEGTMRQLGRFLATEGKTPRVESYLLPGTFELIMQGRKETYLDEVYAGLQQVVQNRPGANVAAAQ
ncbi:hypothetical protein [Paenibacillus rhizovicinus]|uniref:hypothetical protein n=1 Tax=Paenibacillus rhizovicinus TaxID=2704463 RepID=UPI001CDBB7C5|nr:hypothetical protein [Paenibacillus rhizovicinus]